MSPETLSGVNGEVGVWHFKEGAGTAVGDSSGAANNGVTGGAPTWTLGEINNCLNFTNANYVQVPNSASINSINGAFTLQAWAKPSTTGTQCLVCRELSGSLVYGLMLGSNNALLNINGTGLNSGYNVGVGTWEQLSGTFDGTTARIYVNGTLYNSAAQSVPSASATNLFLGTQNASLTFPTAAAWTKSA